MFAHLVLEDLCSKDPFGGIGIDRKAKNMLSRISKLTFRLMGCWAIFTTLSVAQTNQFLEAPVIRGELPIQLDRTGKGLEWLSESRRVSIDLRHSET